MGKNQGLNRLTNGCRRTLNKAEVSRRYLFVTKDVNINRVLNDRFNIYINQKLIMHNTCLDKFGRVIGASVVTKMLANTEFLLRADGRNLIIEF